MKTTILILLSLCGVVGAQDLAVLVQERTAIEHVYYNHRKGQKHPFAEVSPPALIEQLVTRDLHKEAVLKQAYGVDITPALLAAEVARIETSTRAPEMLAEIKAALGNDPAKFARSFAKRFLVERLLRSKFENDDGLHTAQRQACETVRSDLLAAKANGATAAELLAQLQQAHPDAVREPTWELSPPPAEPVEPSPEELAVTEQFGPEAQVLSGPPPDGEEGTLYFNDLPPALRRVLAVQLKQAGDVSAVVETPRGFLLYLCKERTEETLGVAVLSLRKQGFEEWLNAQSGAAP